MRLTNLSHGSFGFLVFCFPLAGGQGCSLDSLLSWYFWRFGLSLFCEWSISVAPVRGGTYFSLP
ncbi:hypothetical protein PQR68_12305, partial [Paraburkholderia agricolaris]|uniref:hypothetical protein n=1 Tax=Paraburkholderia agricolaris TaxID=2152888 RepID=UPI0038B6C5A3